MSPSINKPIQIGITGGIGSGKSIVCKILFEMGFPVFYADDEARELLNNNEIVKKSVQQLLGALAYADSGKADRKYIASQVFNDAELLEKLNSIIHPAVQQHYEAWVELNKNAKAVIKEAAIMFESGSYKGLDFIITVNAPENTRIERIQKRDGMSEEQIAKIMSRQLTDTERNRRSDFIINNDDDTPVMAQLFSILAHILH